jgi:hypothetical protein
VPEFKFKFNFLTFGVAAGAPRPAFKLSLEALLEGEDPMVTAELADRGVGACLAPTGPVFSPKDVLADLLRALFAFTFALLVSACLPVNVGTGTT